LATVPFLQTGPFDVPLIIQVLVAAGTILLASATFLLAWNSVKERKGNEARELAVGAYNPLRMQVLSWMDLEHAYSNASISVWASLKQTQLQLAGRIPKPLTTQLDDAESLLDRIQSLRERVSKDVKAKKEEVAKRFLSSKQADWELMIRFMLDGRYVRWIDPTWAWLARESLDEYVGEYATQFPDDTWDFEVVVGSTKVGGEKEANEVAEKLFESLDKQDGALELRESLGKLSNMAKTINAAIEKELKKH
jgi:hypothetical protein